MYVYMYICTSYVYTHMYIYIYKCTFGIMWDTL